MSRITRHQLTAGFLGLGLALAVLGGQVSAQAPADATRPAGDATRPAGDRMPTTTTTDAGLNNNRATNDEGFNPGWLGLLGLAGLAGLMPKKTHTVTTTTHRPGDANAR